MRGEIARGGHARWIAAAVLLLWLCGCAERPTAPREKRPAEADQTPPVSDGLADRETDDPADASLLGGAVVRAQMTGQVKGFGRATARLLHWFVYEWRDGLLAQTARLDKAWQYPDGMDGRAVVTYTEWRLTDGAMQVTETFTEGDQTPEALDAWLNGPDSFWKLTNARWSAFSHDPDERSMYGALFGGAEVKVEP